MQWLGCLLVSVVVAFGCGGKSNPPSSRSNHSMAGAGAGGAADADADAGVGASAGAAIPAEAGAPDPSAATLNSLSLIPANSTLIIGGGVSFKVMGGYSDGSSRDLTSQAAFVSSSFAVASPIGNVVTALAPGNATITAQVAEQSALAHIIVMDDSVASIEVTSPQAECVPGNVVQLTATAQMKGGTKLDVTTQAAWLSSATGNVVALAQGRALCLSAGSASVSATVGTASGARDLKVTGPKLSAYTLTPTTYKLAHDQEYFKLTASYSDGSTLDLTQYASFASDTPMVLAIGGSAGSVLSDGSAVVTAKLGDTVVASVKFGAATLVSIAITPPELVLEYPAAGTLTATGTYADGSTADISGVVTWDSGDDINLEVDVGGLVTPDSVIESEPVSATLGNVVGHGRVTVHLGKPTEISEEYASVSGSTSDPRIPAHVTNRLLATAQYTDGADADISSLVTWHITDPSIASFDGPQQSELTTHKAGSTTYFATLDSYTTGTHTLTVTNAVLLGFDSANDDPIVVPVGGTVYISPLIGIFDDASTVDLTLQSAWQANDAKVSVTNDAFSGVSIAGLALGTSSVTASALGLTRILPVKVTAQ